MDGLKADNMNTPLEQVNLKVRIDALLFDLLFDRTLLTSRVVPKQMAHNHAVFEMHAIVSGPGILSVEDQEMTVSDGDICLIGPNVFHYMKWAGDKPLTHFSFRFTFRKEPRHDEWFPKEETERILDALSNVTSYRFKDGEFATEMGNVMKCIQEEISKPSEAAYLIVQGLFTQLIGWLTRAIHQTRRSGPSARQLPIKGKDDLRCQVIDAFFKDYRDSLKIEALAEKLNLSVKQVSRLLQQNYCTSFKQKLLDTRIEAAKYRLRTSDVSVQIVAEEVGYATTNNLSRIFIKKLGLTPSEYRKQCRRK